MDVYLSTVSNRLNAVMKQLTIIATIFLPLSVVTGFFGQNFGWLVRHISSFWAFAAFGIGGLIVLGIGADVLVPAQRLPLELIRAGSIRRASETRGLFVAVDVSRVSEVSTEPGELPESMAAWVIREDRLGRAPRRLPGRGDRGARAGRVRGHRARDGGRRELQQRLGGARRARVGLRVRRPRARRPPHRRLGRVRGGMEGRRRGHQLAARRRGRHPLQPGLLRGSRGPRTRPAGRARRRRSGATRRRGAPSPSSPRCRPSSSCTSPRI